MKQCGSDHGATAFLQRCTFAAVRSINTDEPSSGPVEFATNNQGAAP